MNIQPVILSGGSGTRLWPLSRELFPKQLLPLVSQKTMLQETLQRIVDQPVKLNTGQDSLETVAPIVVCNNEHRFLVAEQLRQVGVHGANIILEPCGKNTAPALTVAALACDTDDILLVMPADHVIEEQSAFLQAVSLATELANQKGVITFGIVPAVAETGYGYIQRGTKIKDYASAFTIASFKEKPNHTHAVQYVESGEYFWNSGMFMMKAGTWLQLINQFQPQIFSTCQAAYTGGKKDLDFYRLEDKAFRDCPSDSIDYAVMEKLSTMNTIDSVGRTNAFAAVVALDAGWSDVGSWAALWEVGEQDSHGNVLKGDVFAHNSHDSYFYSGHRFVAGVGLKDTVVVETSDAVLVANKHEAQDVKKIVAWLKNKNRDETLVHRQVFRPWGSYEGVTAGERFQVKRIIVNPGASLSLQMHHHRAEHWVVVRGTAKVTRGEEVFLVSENESTYIPLGTAHRLQNPGTIPLEIIEVQSGSYLGEDDIVRFEDNYGR